MILGTVVSFEEKHEQRELSRDMLTLLIKVNTFNSLRLCQVLRLLGFFPTEDIFNIKKIRFNTRKKNNFKIIDSVKIYIFCIQKNPEEGEWRLANNGANAVSVNVTAQSALDFSSSILEISTGGESYQL